MADEAVHEVAAEPAELTAKDKLRAFEDEVLGKDTPRINGHIERGHGSLYSRHTSPEQKVHYAKLEHLVKAEDKLAHASAELSKAQSEHDAALAAAEKSSDAVSE